MRDGVTNCHNTHDHDPNTILLQATSNIAFWCTCGFSLINNQLNGLFVLKGCLARDKYLHFLQDELPILFNNVSLQAKLNMPLQHIDASPHFGLQVTQYLNP
jgi:hypothetical protein